MEGIVVISVRLTRLVRTVAGYVLIMQTGEEQVAAFVGEHQRRLRVTADPKNLTRNAH